MNSIFNENFNYTKFNNKTKWAKKKMVKFTNIYSIDLYLYSSYVWARCNAVRARACVLYLYMYFARQKMWRVIIEWILLTSYRYLILLIGIYNFVSYTVFVQLELGFYAYA